MSLNGEKRKTRPIKRGGQHPEWDEEVRFSLLEDPSDDAETPIIEGEEPPPLPPKNGKGPRKILGGTLMKLQTFADDPREPDLIGETMVDLTEVLTKGETDGEFHSDIISATNQLTSRRMVHVDEQGQVLRRSVPGVNILVERASFL